MKLAIPMTVTLMTATGIAAAASSESLQSLVDVERAFAQASVTTGMRAAFLQYLADDAIVFRPHPTPGRAYYQRREKSPAVLSWEPKAAEISAAGDMGYTSGPWEYRRGKGTDPVAFGHYVSIWKKQADGVWKVAIDVGIEHNRLVETGETSFREAAAHRFEDAAAARATLVEAEHALASDAAERGVENAVAARASEDIRWYRDGKAPEAGVPKAGRADSTGVALAPLGADAAASGDFGYTYGSLSPLSAGEKPAITDYYFRIWRRDAGGTWRVILDLDSPVPANGD